LGHQLPPHSQRPRPQDRRGRRLLAQLLEHGLVRPSFIPPRPTREQRDLTRYRKSVIEERGREVQDQADDTIAELTEQIVALQDPHEAAVTVLVGIPGVSHRTAQVILAEIGTDMSRFPTAGHLASWAGMCPGNNESAGKHRSGRTRYGSKWLGIALVEAAQAGALKQHLPRRALRPHPGPPKAKKAAVAVGHSVLVIA